MPTRRVILKHGCALGLSVAGALAALPRQTLAAPLAIVSPPRVVRAEECTVMVSVKVGLAGLTPGVSYEVGGDILEGDEPDEEPDFCCTLNAVRTPLVEQPTSTLHLIRQAMAVDLGLVRGIGPAADESYSPDLVELFARIWLRDLATGDRFGPWDSPRRVAVAHGELSWLPPRAFPGGEFLSPRGDPPATVPAGVGQPLPRKLCASSPVSDLDGRPATATTVDEP